jgi:hypothetical protein
VPEDRVVSIQTKKPKYSYAAYGEKQSRPPSDDRVLAARPSK